MPLSIRPPWRERPLSPKAKPSPLRLWPAVAVVIAMFAALLVTRLVWPDSLIQYLGSVAIPLLALLAMGIWWLAFSRLPPRDRVMMTAAMLGNLAIAALVAHRSMVPWGLCIYVLPLMITLPTLWLLFTRRADSAWRGTGTYLAMALPLLFAGLVRIDGVSGSFEIAISPRWSDSAEAEYLASLDRLETDRERSETLPLVLREGDWTGFRGPRRDGVARGVQIRREWPEEGLPEVWRRRIGPGWSSFAVVDGRLFTQEQRGDQEAVLCLDAETGAEIWAHTYPGRFDEMASSTGPRATPTFDDGRIYALGATGKLTALDAASGDLLWQSDLAADSGAAVPEWGFAASPLVVDHRTVVLMAGQPGAKVIAYDTADGSVKWTALRDGRGYSSPQMMTLRGVQQIVALDNHGTFGLEPHTGEVLWSDPWRVELGPRMVQPMQIGDDSVVIGTGYGMGTRRIRLDHSGDQWRVQETWHSRQLKPYFNDFIHHEGYLYGFDHQIVTCIDAATGQRQWKRGRYGFGQVLLIPEQDLLLVSGEQGQLALLRATPKKSDAEEIASFQALNSKTWNHPVAVGKRLYLRNAEEAVCFDIAP